MIGALNDLALICAHVYVLGIPIALWAIGKAVEDGAVDMTHFRRWSELLRYSRLLFTLAFALTWPYWAWSVRIDWR